MSTCVACGAIMLKPRSDDTCAKCREELLIAVHEERILKEAEEALAAAAKRYDIDLPGRRSR